MSSLSSRTDQITQRQERGNRNNICWPPKKDITLDAKMSGERQLDGQTERSVVQDAYAQHQTCHTTTSHPFLSMFFCSACLKRMAIYIGNCMQPIASLSTTKLLDGAVARLDRLGMRSSSPAVFTWRSQRLGQVWRRGVPVELFSQEIHMMVLTNWIKTLHTCKASRMSCCRQLLASLLCVHTAAMRPSCNSVGHWSFVQEKIDELHQS